MGPSGWLTMMEAAASSSSSYRGGDPEAKALHGTSACVSEASRLMLWSLSLLSSAMAGLARSFWMRAALFFGVFLILGGIDEEG